jgi:hypothetical protein
MGTIRAILDGTRATVDEAVPVKKQKCRKMSPEARKRIGDATKKKWAALRMAKAKAGK